MTSIRRSLAIMAAATLLVTLVPAPVEAGSKKLEKKYAKILNRTRMKNGRTPLKLNRKLSKIARKHSKRMAKKGELFHSSSLFALIDRAGVPASFAGENVGRGPNPKAIHRAFLGSPPHRQNILSPSFDRIGVGVVRRAGLLWITLLFVG